MTRSAPFAGSIAKSARVLASMAFPVDRRTSGERVRLIRCYNVLRQYEETAVHPALDTMVQALGDLPAALEATLAQVRRPAKRPATVRKRASRSAKA